MWRTENSAAVCPGSNVQRIRESLRERLTSVPLPATRFPVLRRSRCLERFTKANDGSIGQHQSLRHRLTADECGAREMERLAPRSCKASVPQDYRRSVKIAAAMSIIGSAIVITAFTNPFWVENLCASATVKLAS